jgi:hypothetical protein
LVFNSILMQLIAQEDFSEIYDFYWP